jgi:hypothetical protein
VDEIRPLLEDYSEAFSGDHRHTAAFYETPANVIMPGQFRVLATMDDVVQFIEEVLARIGPLGYANTTCDSISVKLLNSRTALASVVGVRRRADGSEMPRAGFTYLLTDNGGWKIRQLIATELDKLI